MLEFWSLITNAVARLLRDFGREAFARGSVGFAGVLSKEIECMDFAKWSARLRQCNIPSCAYEVDGGGGEFAPQRLKGGHRRDKIVDVIDLDDADAFDLGLRAIAT
jgi:hypothetical protein